MAVYVRQAPATLESHPAKALAFFGGYEVLEGKDVEGVAHAHVDSGYHGEAVAANGRTAGGGHYHYFVQHELQAGAGRFRRGHCAVIPDS